MLRGIKLGLVFAALLSLVTGLSAAPASAAPPGGRVVVIGVPGLMWKDVTRDGTPALWRLAEDGASGSLSVRTTRVSTCPTDGWLSVSAGQRARLPDSSCMLPAEPEPSGAGAAAAGWQAIKQRNAGDDYHARVGLLGQAVRSAGGCTFAVGPGAVYGAADASGRVDRYAPTLERVDATDWSRCALSAVEVDDVFRAYLDAGVDADGEPREPSDRSRATAAAKADRKVSQVLAAVPAGTTVLVAGVSDDGPDPHLRLAIAHSKGSGPFAGTGSLTSSATRQPGLVTLTDVTATVLKVLGLPLPGDAVGSPWRSEPPPGGESTTERVESLEDSDVAAQAIRQMQGPFFWVLGGAQLLLYVLAALVLRRRSNSPESRARILAGTRVVALAGAATPVATFLAGLVPWWESDHPAPALLLTLVGFAGLMTAAALAGPWRRSVTTPGLVIAAATALVLAIDVMTGSVLQLNGLMGHAALVAGRFYGFGNQAFALFSVAAILAAAWLAEYPLRAGRRGLAVAIVAAIGVAAVAVDGAPQWGSDFGGVLALVPSFAVLVLLVAGWRVSVPRLVAFCLAGAVIVLLISYLNARSANPTHLGRFWQDLVNGEAWDVVVRKLGAMLRSLGYWQFMIPLAGAVVFLYMALLRPIKARTPLLERAYAHSATMRPAMLAALTVGVAGMLVNDSGISILSVALSLATPLMLAACVRALELEGDDAGTSPPERSESPSSLPG